MTIKVCRLMRDFPSLRSIENVSASDVREKEIEYVEYGLAPGIYSLMREQVSLGAHMHIIAARRENVADYENVGCINVYRVNRPYNISALMKMKKLEDTVGVDIVHAHATSAISYALLRRFMKRKPYVIHVHGTTAGVINALKILSFKAPKRTFKEKFWTWVSLKRQELMWKRADLLIAVSNNIADELCKFYDVHSDKIRVVHNGVDVDVFKPVNEETRQNARKKLGIQGEPVILYVGHLSPRKGLQYLLRAAPKVIAKFPKATFVFLGGTPKFVKRTDYQKIWIDLAANLGISRNIIFAGEVRHRNAVNFYAASDAFVFPTLYEGLAKALLEAMACGLPVVATNVGGNPDVITHGETGLLIEPDNVDQLADALIKVLSEPSLARDMGLRARGIMEKHFTWKVAARKIMAIYEEMLK